MNKMVKILGSVLLILTSLYVHSAPLSLGEGLGVRLPFPEGELIKADEHFKTGHFKEALVLYNALTTQDLYVQQKIALCYYYVNDYSNAEKAFEKIAEKAFEKIIDQMVDVNTVAYYAEVLLNQQKYKEAAVLFKKYKDAGGTFDVANHIASCTWAPENMMERPDFRVKTTNIETGGRSLGMTFFKEGAFYAVAQEQNVNDRTVFYDLAFATKQDSLSFSPPTVLAEKGLNSTFYEGSPSVSPDGKWLYFTKNASQKEEVNIKRKAQNKISSEGVNVLQLFMAENINGVWSNIKPLPVNSIEYSCTHPSISPDGKTLYFVSNMPGGMGGYDIYKMERNNVVVGGFGKPENLGKKVNSKGNEMFPSQFKETLYFASNGFTGFGGYDIYSTDVSGKLPGIANLGIGMNSSKDDFAAVFNADGETGYLSSNREGDHGYDMIYYFSKIWYPFTVNGVVKDKVSLKAIPKANVKVVDSKGREINLATDDKGNLSLELYPNLAYTVTFSKEGYVSKTVEIPAFTNPEDILALLEISLEVEAKKDVVMNLDNIYFAFAKAEPLPESLPILDRLTQFMNDHPEIKIELSAHTDCRGSNEANADLSTRRAQACYDYLVTKSVNPKRMVPKGYGESKLLNQCKDGIECSEDLHQKNRRVEIKIL